MRISFLTEGNKQTGYGHLTRMMGLAQAAKMSVSESAITFILKADDFTQDVVEANDFRFENCSWHVLDGKSVAEIEESDIIVIDSYLASDDIYRRIYELKHKDAMLIVIDDYNRINYSADILINPSIYGSHILYEGNYRRILSGSEYIILRPPFWKNEFKTSDSKVNHVLVTLGGAPDLKLMDKLIQWLKEYDVMIHAMGSPDLKSQNIKTYSRLSGSEVKELMRKVDICVSAGGQTTYELMAVGTPFIPIGCAENQRMNMNAIQQAGLISEVLWSDQPNLIDRLANVWNSFEDKDKRIKNSLKSQTFIDGQGVFRIWDIIKELKFVST